MARIDDLLHSVGLHALAKPKIHPVTDDTGDEQAIPLDTAFLTDRPTRMLMGPRGRDPGGYPKVIPAGMPPAVFGEPRRLILPKDKEIPPRPPKTDQRISIAVTANTGDIIDIDVGFPVRSIMLDNYSHVWLLLDAVQRWIPPLTIGWCLPVYRASSKVHISASAPTGHTQIAVTAGDVINVITTEERLTYSPGVAVPTG